MMPVGKFPWSCHLVPCACAILSEVWSEEKFEWRVWSREPVVPLAVVVLAIYIGENLQPQMFLVRTYLGYIS